MSELQAIQGALERTALRRRWQRAWNGFWRGLFVGALIWLVALATFKLAPIPSSILIGAGALAALSLLTGFFHGWLRKPTLQETARWVDDNQKLQERMSTALELAAAGGNENWRALLISDAARFAAKLDPRKLFPYRLPSVTRWALLALILSAGLGFAPEYRSKDYLQKKDDALAIKEAGKRLLELTRHDLQQRPPALEPTRQALQSVEELGARLDKNPLTRSDALKDLANVTEKLKAQLKDLGQKNPSFKMLEKEARESNRSNGSTAANDKELDSAQKTAAKNAENAAALDKLGDELQKAQKAAAGMPNDNSPAAEAARQKMSQTLADIAKKAKEMGQPLPDLDGAIAALEANQSDNFQKDMEMATEDLEKMKETAKALDQMQQQADHQGKDLPEQLKFGQAEAAQQTLQKMADQLKSGKMTPEEAAKMLDEISRSVSPASPYGKASDFLKQAAQQMKGGDKPSAAQSLADASKELEKILAQMEDAKALAGSLDALKKAETCIATHKNWGQCPHCGDCSGRCLAAGHCLGLGLCRGKGPGGRGVGTWTDDDSQLYPKMSGLWDNSGINRPDTDPRGLTDRGDAQLADNLAPTKLHGQITPGGPMPSIKLKGVSIKGQSAVQYQEAAAAAQSDAQSALNQDQVPRAYQGTVKDYFDDLKK